MRELAVAERTAAVEMATLTLKSGDPSDAGALAGVALEIPSFHILESEIMAQVDPALAERERAMAAMAIDVPQVVAPLQVIRSSN